MTISRHRHRALDAIQNTARRIRFKATDVHYVDAGAGVDEGGRIRRANVESVIARAAVQRRVDAVAQEQNRVVTCEHIDH